MCVHFSHCIPDKAELADDIIADKKQCLTIDTPDIEELGPEKFRRQADSGIEQICDYNRNKKDMCLNSLMAVGKQTLFFFK